MPNWVKNKIELSGKPEDIKSCLNSIKGDNGAIDFRKIVPMPDSLLIAASPGNAKALVAYLTDNCTKPLSKNSQEIISKYFPIYAKPNFEKIVDDVKKDIETKGCENLEDYSSNRDGSLMLTLYQAGKIYNDNIEHYDFPNWYEWSINNWGTKWNACAAEAVNISDGLCEIYFDTAWETTSETKFDTLLAEKFPNLNIVHSWSEENLGDYCGVRMFEKGEISGSMVFENDSKEAFEQAFDLWGIDIDDPESGWSLSEDGLTYEWHDPFGEEEISLKSEPASLDNEAKDMEQASGCLIIDSVDFGKLENKEH